MARFELRGLDGRLSRIEYERGLEAHLGTRLEVGARSSRFLIHDPAVTTEARRLGALLEVDGILATSGAESAKNLQEIERLAIALMDAGADRGSQLIALGGGAVLDLVAFLAGVYMRGVACALLPTSFLAIVDASVGGKSAVDVGGLKNILGLFRQPDLVLCDPDWMATLPDPEFRQGVAEVIKMAAILDEEVLHHLEAGMADLKHREDRAVDEAACAAIRMKLAVVEADEREAGRRALLNFGHTLGHAIETVSGHQVSHGDAVAMGMIGEMDMLGRAHPRLEALLATAGLPTRIPEPFRDTEKLWQAMLRDKKTRAGRVQVATPDELGSGSLKTLVRHQLENLR